MFDFKILISILVFSYNVLFKKKNLFDLFYEVVCLEK